MGLDVKQCKRGEIYYVDVEGGIGSEQKGERPALIIQNDIGNTYSTTTIVSFITSISKKKNMPVHVGINPEESGLPKESMIMLEQIRTVDKRRLIRKVSELSDEKMKKVDEAIKISLLS